MNDKVFVVLENILVNEYIISYVCIEASHCTLNETNLFIMNDFFKS